MGYINVGAHINGSDPSSKKALKEAIKTQPDRVKLYSTSAFDVPFNTAVKNLPDGKYSLTGPNPYDSRKWYAQIEVRGGKVKVS